jgi:hypothetical protein
MLPRLLSDSFLRVVPVGVRPPPIIQLYVLRPVSAVRIMLNGTLALTFCPMVFARCWGRVLVLAQNIVVSGRVLSTGEQQHETGSSLLRVRPCQWVKGAGPDALGRTFAVAAYQRVVNSVLCRGIL